MGTRPSKTTPDRGIVIIAYETRTKHDETVMTYRVTHLFLKAPAD